MNSKGDLTGLLFFIVSIAAFAIFLLIVGTVVPLISSELANRIGISAEINNSLGVSKTVSENTFPVLWIILFSGLMLGLFATAYFVPTHPIFVPIFALLLIVAVVVAIPLSNAYEELAANATLSGASAQQGLIYFMMINLPYITLVVGLIVLVITFAKPGGNVSLG